MKDKVNATMNRMDRAFGLLRKIFVHEDDVDHMAYAQRELRAAYRELNSLKEKLSPQKEQEEEKNG